ncbi:MAG: hypothetical protein ACREQ1_11060 [Woeseiaceae bacterium]
MMGRTCRIWLMALPVLSTSATAEVFVDFGAQTSRVEARIANMEDTVETTESGVHFGIGVSRRVGELNEFGARLEVDTMGSDLFLAVRALDYRRHLSERFSISGFLGAARLDLATPAYGYYLGGGLQLKEVLRNLDLNLDLRYGDKVARDNLLPTDPQGGSPDNFYDITGISLYLSYRF